MWSPGDPLKIHLHSIGTEKALGKFGVEMTPCLSVKVPPQNVVFLPVGIGGSAGTKTALCALTVQLINVTNAERHKSIFSRGKKNEFTIFLNQ